MTTLEPEETILQDQYDEYQGDDDNPYGIELFTVSTPSGSEIKLQTKEESDWYRQRRDRYLQDNKFTNVSDLLDLDRLLTLEVMVFRWGSHLSQGFGYTYEMVNPHELQRHIRDHSQEIRLLKQSMGIDKTGRERNKGEQLGDYIANLLERAKVFGVHRNRQYEAAVTKMYELRSMVLTHERCDERERRELDLSYDSIIQWIKDHIIKEWDEIDADFRKHQSMWVREL